MTRKQRDDAPDASADPSTPEERFLEAFRFEMAVEECAAYEPTAAELREADDDFAFWQAKIMEQRRANLLSQAKEAAAVPPVAPNLAGKTREWLLARLGELRALATHVPGGVRLAYRNLDGDLGDVPTEELRSQVADLELALLAERVAKP